MFLMMVKQKGSPIAETPSKLEIMQVKAPPSFTSDGIKTASSSVGLLGLALK